MNKAVTDWFDVRVRLQLSAPLQAPLQPPNTEPGAGVATKLTAVPEGNAAEHVEPQLTPVGKLVTRPVPLPTKLTEAVYCGTKEAVRSLSEVISTEQAPVPTQLAPLHP